MDKIDEYMQLTFIMACGAFCVSVPIVCTILLWKWVFFG